MCAAGAPGCYEARAAVYLTMEGAVDHIDLWLTPGEAPLLDAEEVARTIADELAVRWNGCF